MSVAFVARTRACTSEPVSSPWNSPICHWRVRSHSGSNRRAFELVPMSALEHCGSSRVQLVIEDVVGTPESVFGAF